MTWNRLFNQWRRLISHLVQISLKRTLAFLSLAIEYKSRAQCYSLSHFEINRILWSLESKLLLLYIDNCLPYWCMSRSMHKNVDMKTNYWTSGYFKLQWRISYITIFDGDNYESFINCIYEINRLKSTLQ